MNGVERSGFALQCGIQRMNGIEFVDFRPFQFADKQHIRDDAKDRNHDLLHILWRELSKAVIRGEKE